MPAEKKNSPTAETDNGKVVLSSEGPDYGFNQRDKLFLVTFSIITGIVLYFSFPLLSFSNGDGKTLGLMRYMSISIFVLLFVGMWKGYRHLKIIAIENGIVSSVLSAIKGRSVAVSKATIAPPTFDDLSRIIPFPSQGNNPVCRNMMVRILRDATDYIYDQREAVVRPYKEELNDRLLVFGSLQTTALRLGILGTFIGLIIAMVNLGGIQNFFPATEILEAAKSAQEVGRRELLVEFSEKLFSSLHVAFGTSVAGLEVAILLTFLNMFLRSSQKVLFRKMDESAGEMMSLARRATYKDKGLLSSFSQMKSAMENLELKIHHENQTTIRSIEALGDRVVEQTGLIDRGLGIASHAQDHWQLFLENLKEQQGEVFKEALDHRTSVEKAHMGFMVDLENREKVFIKDLSRMLDLFSVDKLGKDLLESISVSGQKIEQSIGENTRQVTRDLGTAGKDLKQAVTLDIVGLRDQLKSNRDSEEKLTGAFDQLVENTKIISTQLEKSKLNAETFDKLQTNLETTLKDVQYAQLSFQKDIGKAIEGLHSIPIDERISGKIAEVSGKILNPIDQSLHRMISEIGILNETATTVKRGVNYLDRIFSNPLLKISHKVALIVGMISGVGFIATITFIIATRII